MIHSILASYSWYLFEYLMFTSQFVYASISGLKYLYPLNTGLNNPFSVHFMMLLHLPNGSKVVLSDLNVPKYIA